MSAKPEKKNNSASIEAINPDGAIRRGYLTENVKVFNLQSIEKKTIVPHYHEFHKVIIFSGGQVSYIVEGNRYELHPGNIVIIPAYSVHQPVISPNHEYIRSVIWLSIEAADYMGLKDLFARPSVQGAHVEESTVIDPVISESMKYINSHLDEELSIDKLCEEAYLSKSSFIRRFKEATGYTPHRYICNKRLVRSTELLRSGMSSAAAANAAGFNDYSVFYKAFKTAYGINPGKY